MQRMSQNEKQDPSEALELAHLYARAPIALCVTDKDHRSLPLTSTSEGLTPAETNCIIHIQGESGMGKTTIVRTIFGLSHQSLCTMFAVCDATEQVHPFHIWRSLLGEVIMGVDDILIAAYQTPAVPY